MAREQYLVTAIVVDVVNRHIIGAHACLNASDLRAGIIQQAQMAGLAGHGNHSEALEERLPVRRADLRARVAEPCPELTDRAAGIMLPEHRQLGR